VHADIDAAGSAALKLKLLGACIGKLTGGDEHILTPWHALSTA
jgi:hypothetical protein